MGIKMSFIEKIKTEMYDAMKSGEKDKAGALRTLLAKLKDKEINTRKELSEQDGLTVIKTLVKQRKESVAMYEKANRPELADKEKNELEKIIEDKKSDKEISIIYKSYESELIRLPFRSTQVT